MEQFVNRHMGKHQATTLLAPWGAEVEIDNGMVPLVTDLWNAGIPTFSSCEGYVQPILQGGTERCPWHVSVDESDYPAAYIIAKRHDLNVVADRRTSWGVFLIFF